MKTAFWSCFFFSLVCYEGRSLLFFWSQVMAGISPSCYSRYMPHFCCLFLYDYSYGVWYNAHEMFYVRLDESAKIITLMFLTCIHINSKIYHHIMSKQLASQPTNSLVTDTEIPITLSLVPAMRYNYMSFPSTHYRNNQIPQFVSLFYEAVSIYII
jgi:hypothetical protein